ncbi:MAG: hypothetical protein WDZ96_02200 [Acidimicrobiia bacterium]
MVSTTSQTEYRYENFRLSHLLADMRFDPDTPAPGDRLPQLDLQTLAGDRINFEDLDRPHLFVFGSNTCPMTTSAGDVVEDLHREFGDEIRFVLVQVREAHPGEHIPQPISFEQKKAHARKLRDALDVRFTVAVDDLDGSFHASLDPKPNAAYLVDTQGTILFRSMWSSDHKALYSALAATSAGSTPDKLQSTRTMGPFLRAVGYVDRVIRSAGPSASRDLLRSAPPMLLGARLAGLFHQVSPNRRGHALLATTGAIVLAVIAALALLL